MLFVGRFVRLCLYLCLFAPLFDMCFCCEEMFVSITIIVSHFSSLLAFKHEGWHPSARRILRRTKWGT
jgi:hypothetical protein